jgi:hypothetical protein
MGKRAIRHPERKLSRFKTMPIEPKLCPFCRSDKIMCEGTLRRVAAVCQKCLARGPEVESRGANPRDRAVEAWNTRTLYFVEERNKQKKGKR